MLTTDEGLNEYLTADAIRAAVDARGYVGDAPQRALALARRIGAAVDADNTA